MTEEGLQKARRATSVTEVTRVVSDEDVSARPLAIGALLGAPLLCALQVATGMGLESSSIATILATYFFLSLLGAGSGVMVGAMVLCIKEALVRRRLLGWLDAEAWRPRAGARHPRDRTDTEPRWMIERRLDGVEVEIGVRRWTYGQTWKEGPLFGVRRFSIDELDVADVYADGLIESAERGAARPGSLGLAVGERPEDRKRLERGSQRLLADWISERDERSLLAENGSR